MEFWLKLMHISAMAVWFAGLFFLPRLFLAKRRDETDGEAVFFNPVANALFFRVATPAALVTIALGMVLIAYNPGGGAWLVMKLVVVAMAVLLHLYYGLLLYELGQGNERHGPWFYRVAGWMPLLLLLTVAAITGAKPDTAAGLPPPPARVGSPSGLLHNARPVRSSFSGGESVGQTVQAAGGASGLLDASWSSPYTPMP